MVKNARVLPFVHNTEEYFAFKVDTIKWVNARLGDPTLATRDTTMGSILVLSCFEVSFSTVVQTSMRHPGRTNLLSICSIDIAK
jgi:hypothetical protein